MSRITGRQSTRIPTKAEGIVERGNLDIDSADMAEAMMSVRVAIVSSSGMEVVNRRMVRIGIALGVIPGIANEIRTQGGGTEAKTGINEPCSRRCLAGIEDEGKVGSEGKNIQIEIIPRRDDRRIL